MSPLVDCFSDWSGLLDALQGYANHLPQVLKPTPFPGPQRHGLSRALTKTALTKQLTTGLDQKTECPIILPGFCIPNSAKMVGAISVSAGLTARIARLLSSTPGTRV